MNKKKLILAALILIFVATAVVAAILIKSNSMLKSILPAIQTSPRSSTIPTNPLGLVIPEGFSIDVFARDLDAVRDLEFDDKNNLLVSVPSKGKVLALYDTNGDGKAESKRDILTNLQRPHGLAFYQGQLFVAEEAKLARYSWNPDNLSATLDKVILDLPRGGRHFTRTIAFDKDGKMYVSLGSTCDTCVEKHPWIAAVIVSDKDGNNPQVFARGLRNSVFVKINPSSNKLWATEMGRDFLGDKLPPDEVNILQEGQDYGWPRCYGNKFADTKFNSNLTRSDCENTTAPIVELCAHCAPLGLEFINSDKFPKDWQGDLLVALHGSWNSSIPVGYKVIKLNVDGDKVTNQEDFISGFQEGKNNGRPVDLAFDREGNLYISDDRAGVVYKMWH